ncbi:hypothetical protein D9611_012572 [Ephemerocybe angulata]|uniref:Reverse transcriptase domain-containing protein n=1 Tax=Ephemerocybe angulata TaxID=980116 RepID=A0A8H5AUT6_9AGAR|nr:hypothetical protein D9611_012572 [Tulosesus angulatus]
MGSFQDPRIWEFWRVFKRLWCASSFETVDFTAEELRVVFEARMNPIVPTPSSFDSERLRLNQIAAAVSLQGTTPDETPLRSFSRWLVLGDIEKGKLRIRQKLDSATGEDQVSYRDIFDMDNECLLELCNRCLELGGAPSSWLRTKLVGLCKKGKPKDAPESYRTIGLESCFLKFMTLLIDERLVEWAERGKILPPSQNGFRKGYRTNNNVFVLQAAVDKAVSDRRPLYAAFVDLTNAFPATEHSTLWLKLRRLGAGGRMFDWLRWLYGEMSYVVSHGGETSTPFKSSVGILIGDTCSPVLWALYMSDLPQFIPKDGDDVELSGVAVTNVEQADDVLLMSTSEEGLRKKVEGIYRWCSVNFMLFNETKSVVLVFGRSAKKEVFEWGDGGEMAIRDEVTYLGFQLSTRAAARSKLGTGIFRKHYDVKEKAAARIAGAICGVP